MVNDTNPKTLKLSQIIRELIDLNVMEISCSIPGSHRIPEVCDSDTFAKWYKQKEDRENALYSELDMREIDYKRLSI